MNNYDLTKLVPQRVPMLFLSGVQDFDFDNQTLVTRVDITENDLLYNQSLGGVPSCATLEFMAQSIACCVGLNDLHKNPTQKPVIGFVLGSRKISVYNDVYFVNHSYFVHVKSMFCDDNIASFDCQIFDENNNLVANGALNAFRPDDIKTFMEQQ